MAECLRSFESREGSYPFLSAKTLHVGGTTCGRDPVSTIPEEVVQETSRRRSALQARTHLERRPGEELYGRHPENGNFSVIQFLKTWKNKFDSFLIICKLNLGVMTFLLL